MMQHLEKGLQRGVAAASVGLDVVFSKHIHQAYVNYPLEKVRKESLGVPMSDEAVDCERSDETEWRTVIFLLSVSVVGWSFSGSWFNGLLLSESGILVHNSHEADSAFCGHVKQSITAAKDLYFKASNYCV